MTKQRIYRVFKWNMKYTYFINMVYKTLYIEYIQIIVQFNDELWYIEFTNRLEHASHKIITCIPCIMGISVIVIIRGQVDIRLGFQTFIDYKLFNSTQNCWLICSTERETGGLFLSANFLITAQSKWLTALSSHDQALLAEHTCCRQQSRRAVSQHICHVDFPLSHVCRTAVEVLPLLLVYEINCKYKYTSKANIMRKSRQHILNNNI